MGRAGFFVCMGMVVGLASTSPLQAGEVQGKQNINVKNVVQTQGGIKTKQEVDIGNVTGKGKISGDQNINVGNVVQSQGGINTKQKTRIGNVE